MQLIRSYFILAIKLSAMDPAAPRDTAAGASRSRPRRITFTRSPHDAEILRLAVPAFGALVAEPLFLLADAAIVGRIGTTALGGLGVASQALTTLVSISIFLAYGTTAAVARQLGAGNRAAAIRQGIDGLWLAGAIGVVVLAAGWPLAPAIIHAFGASPGVTAGAVTYLRISLLGAPAMLGVLAGTGVLRGLQDTRTPLAVAVGANLMNIVLNAVLVLGLGWGLGRLGLGHGGRPERGGRRLPRHRGQGRPPGRGGLRPGPGRGAGCRGGGRGAGGAHAFAAGGARGDHRDGGPDGRRRDRRPPDRVPALDAAGVRPGRDSDRGPGHHRQVPRGGRRGRRQGGYPPDDGLGCGLRAGVRGGPAGGRPFLPGVFAVTPGMAGLLLAVLLVAAVQQPVAGVVFVLDGVLIGAGDQNYLALAGLAATAVFAVAALWVHAAGGGLVALWLALSLWMVARFVTLTLRARGTAWLVTGAVRR